MKPLNQKERNNALLKYILALAVVLLLFGIVFYMGSNVSKKEMEVLRSQNEEFKTAMNKQTKMLGLMDSIEANLAVLDKPDANATFSEGMVTNLIIQMNNELSDSSSSNTVYKRIAADYKKMMDDKAMIRNLKKDSESGGDCAKELEKAQALNLEYMKMLTNAGLNVPK